MGNKFVYLCLKLCDGVLLLFDAVEHHFVFAGNLCSNLRKGRRVHVLESGHKAREDGRDVFARFRNRIARPFL
jgi:hypothetical protein